MKVSWNEQRVSLKGVTDCVESGNSTTFLITKFLEVIFFSYVLYSVSDMKIYVQLQLNNCRLFMMYHLISPHLPTRERERKKSFKSDT